MKLNEEKTMKLVFSVLVTLCIVCTSLWAYDMHCMERQVPAYKHVRGYTLLSGQEIPVDMDSVLFRYATYLRVQGDVAVVFDLHNADYYCHAFTYPDFEYISSFGKRGEGPDEILVADNVRWAGKGEMWLLDNNKNRMTRFSGIACGKTPKIEEHVKLEQSLMRALDFDMYNSKQAVVPDYSGANRFCWVELPSGKMLYKWMEIPAKDKVMLAKSPQATAAGWRSFMGFTPDKKRLVTVNQFAERLDIYEVATGKCSTWIGEENQEPHFLVTPEGYGLPNGNLCHYDVQVTDRYIYSVSDGRSFKEIKDEKAGYKQGGRMFRIHNLHGKLLQEYMFDRPIVGIYVDEASGILYGLDVNSDEQIVKFPEFQMPQEE